MQAAESLRPGLENEVFLGEWSMRDLVAHLIGWDHANRDAAQDIREGQLPAFYELRDADWRTINRQFVREYNKGSWAELLEAAKQSQARLWEYVGTIPDDELLQDFGVRYNGVRVTIARLLAAEASDEKKHYEQIQEWLAKAHADHHA